MCCIAIWIPHPAGARDEFGRVARPLTRVLNQGTVIIDNDSLPSERSLRSDFDYRVVYGCFEGVGNSDCVPALRQCRCREPLLVSCWILVNDLDE